MAAYMRNQFLFYGIKAPERRKLYQDFLKKAKKGKEIDWKLLDQAFHAPYREFQYFALDYLERMEHFLVYEDLLRLEGYALLNPWWDTIDRFDCLMGGVRKEDPRVDQLMISYSLSDHFWLRRIAINHQRKRKEKTNLRLLQEIIENNLGQEEFFINKAIGWALREYSKTNPKWVKKFIDDHPSMNSLSVREGSKYLD